MTGSTSEICHGRGRSYQSHHSDGTVVTAHTGFKLTTNSCRGASVGGEGVGEGGLVR